jgi:hypothetical protein
MKLPNAEHTARPWRIHEFTADFRLLDVWALPTPGGHDDFPLLVRLWNTFEPLKSSSWAVRMLFAIRLVLGQLLQWDDPDTDRARPRSTLRDRLPTDLRENPATDSSAGPSASPFQVVYETDNEWAAELINRTFHGIVHLGWVSDRAGGYRGQLAILVKPNGLFGTAYLVAIAPFRYLIVYPRMLAELEQKWSAQTSKPGR